MSVLVSVIIPVHNGEKYLTQCLDAVIGQTLNSLEIICVNDGSTDSSVQILNDYANRDSRIRIISQEASNAGHARNTGLTVATGEYLSFLDADDWFELDMLESMANLAQKTDSDIVFCKAATYDQKTGMQSAKSFSLKERLVPKEKVFSGRDIAEDLFQFCRTAAWDKLYKASFINSMNLRFQEQPRMNDCFFSTIANIRAKRMAVCNKFFVHYRINTGTSITSVSPDLAYACTVNTFQKVQNSMTDEELRIFGKSWKNFVIKNVVNEIFSLSEDFAFRYYRLLDESGLSHFKMKRNEVYDHFLYTVYVKFLDRKQSESSFKTSLANFTQQYYKKKKQANWKKSLIGLLSLMRSHRLKSIFRQLKNALS